MSRKLQYFNFGGYAEVIRYMLHYGNLDFEDVWHKREEWPIQSIKDSLPYGQFPVYEENGRTINQSFAIARYVASQVDLLPTDPWEQAVLDAAALNVHDFAKKIVPLVRDPSKKEANKKDIDETIDFFFSRFEKELKAGNGYFGGKLSWADFLLATMIESFKVYIKRNIQTDYPMVQKLVVEINSLPSVKKYLETRKPYSFGK